MIRSVLLTCEHAGNEIPPAYAGLFRGAARMLAGHRGWDPGSLEIGHVFRKKLGAPLLYTKTSRLLVEVNRSLGHPQLFSEFTRQLDPTVRQEILARHYQPHRDRVETWIAGQVESGRGVIHLSLHTFTPVLNNEVRHTDVGLLYDPRRTTEKLLCRHWRGAIRQSHPSLRVRCNYPYRGSADGLTTHLRRRFEGRRYLGIELEVNQRLSQCRSSWRKLAANLAAAFQNATRLSQERLGIMEEGVL